MKNFKRILIVIMALCMILAVAITANAATTYSITINHPNPAKTHTYEAYQIFKGDLSTNALGKEILSNVEWGDGIDGANFLTALHSFTAFAGAADAAEVAEILGTHSNNAEVVSAFARTAGQYLTSVKTNSTASADNKTYTIAGLTAGYYLVKDADGTLDSTLETYTNYILQVIGNTEMSPKSGRTTVDKVIHDGSEHVEASDYSIGDTVHFELHGTLPENYGKFTKFNYEFVDTMSKGLTYTADSLKVYLENAGTEAILENPISGTPYYTVTTTDLGADGTKISVNFADLKAITGRTIDDHTRIIVKYDAVLNKDAVIGNGGNPNKVYIDFDNDPYSDGKGRTPEDVVYAFTFELDVNKVDGQTAEALENAKFVLYRELLGTKHYAVLDAEGKIDSWTEAEASATLITSDAAGKLAVKGLEADVYYLEEKEAPVGYNLLTTPVKVDIIAEVAEGTSGGEVVDLKIKVDNAPYVEGNKANGTVEMTVVNNPGSTLPETGGMGTTLFYIVGSILVLGAVTILASKKRMSYNG